MKISFITACTLMLVLAGCGGNEMLIPKPPTFLRRDFPPHTYQAITGNCPYSFELNKDFSWKPVVQDGKETCHKDIDLGKLNGVISFSYIEMTNPLKDYINYANDKVEEHQVKADAIEDHNIIRKEDKVYGTFFELKGNVASPFQFYLTDSVSRFVSGVVYFNAVPNYDSLKPSLDYLRTDLDHLISTFRWK